jgi:exopolysaccharide biosynthesis operon protein EpsL
VTKPLLSFRCTALASLVGLALLFAGPVRAEFPDGDIAKFTLGAGVAYDDNIFRLPAGTRAPASSGSTARGDTIFTLNAGATINKDVSRQNFVLNANVIQGLYTQHTSFDYTLFNFGGIWNWQVGSQVGGQIGYTRVQYPNYFLDVRSFNQNIRSVGTPFASVGYQFHPNWEVRARYEFAQVTNSLERFSLTNLDENRYQGGVRYRTEFGNLVDLYYRYTDGTRPNFVAVGPLEPSDRTYNGNEVGIDVERWELSGRSRFSGFLAYTTRDYPNFSARNFSGPTGNATFVWLPTSSTTLNLSVYRLIGLFTDVTANYIITTGVALRPGWQATGRLGLGLVASYENRDYAGDPLPGTIVPKRDDNWMLVGVNANYAITRTLQGTLYYTWTKRNSNIAIFDFVDNTVGAGVQWTF